MIFRYINLYIFCIMYATILIYLLSCSVVCKMLPGFILFLSCTVTSHSLSALVSSKNEEKLFHILWLQVYFYLKCCWQARQRGNNNKCGYNMLVYMARLSTLPRCSVRYDWEGVVLLCRYTYMYGTFCNRL